MTDPLDTLDPLTPAEETFGESYDIWPDVLAVSADGRWRLARSREDAPATQWLVQVRHGGGRWESRIFFQEGNALRAYRRDALRLSSAKDRRDIDAAFTDTLIGPVIDSLPEHCPQRDKPLASEAAVLSRRVAGQASAAARKARKSRL